MDARQILAYLLLALIAAALIGAWFYVTRERRADHRAHRANLRRSRRRIEESAEHS